jgi:hypothetical protein
MHPSPEPSPSRGEGIAGVNAFLGARLRRENSPCLGGNPPEADKPNRRGGYGGERGESRIWERGQWDAQDE